MASDDATRKSRLREAIRLHLTMYPLAGDTPEGIVACWLPRKGYEDAPEHIAAVLEEMVAERWLRVQKLADGKVLYLRGVAFDA